MNYVEVKKDNAKNHPSQDDNLTTNRRDIYGNVISKKSKKHKISFIDIVSQDKQLAEIKEVESYRIYNRITHKEECKDDSFNHLVNENWKCLIF